MRLYAVYNSKNDPDTLKKISDEVGLSEKTVSEILRSGFHNMQFVDFYRSYADKDSEESREDVTCDYTFEPCGELLRQEKTEAVFGALDELSSAEAAEIIYHKGLDKMRDKLKKKGIYHP